MDVVNGFAQKGSHRNNLQLGAAFKLVGKGNGVCDKYLRKSLCAVDAVNGGARQHTVRSAGHNLGGTVFQQHVSTGSSEIQTAFLYTYFCVGLVMLIPTFIFARVPKDDAQNILLNKRN